MTLEFAGDDPGKIFVWRGQHYCAGLGHCGEGLSLKKMAGLIAGVVGAGPNYFLSFYIRWAAPNPMEFRATNIVISGFMNLWRALVTLVAALITLKLTVEALLLMPAVYAGVWRGRKLTGSLSSKRYFGLFRWLLLIAASSLIWKGTAALN